MLIKGKVLFNSVQYLLFFPIFFILFWSVKKYVKVQNILILLASYIFYGWWDWRFLSLIFISSLVDYFVGDQIFKSNSKKNRKILLAVSLIVNLGALMVFKYYNFFANELIQFLSLFSITPSFTTLNVVLPVGISFYTFQTLSYSIDVYRGKLEPSNNIIQFMAFVSFFPQLVAGPIERASNLLPQFSKERNFDFESAKVALRQILWGLFMKVVIADNAAVNANMIFENYEIESGSTLFLGALFFTFQIYGDFAGYSNIAIGSAKLLGFDLMKNFAFPYFSRDIAEFWRRWHISLSTWFRDYLYIPLGGSRVAKNRVVLNTIIIFVVSGFWHGANWTFIAWGALNALYFLPLIVTDNNRKNIEVVAEDKLLPSIREFLSILITFFMTVVAWVFFRSETITQAFLYLYNMFDLSFFTIPNIKQKSILIFIVFFVFVEWINRRGNFGLDISKKTPRIVRWGLYYFLIALIVSFGGQQQDFIYFQF